MDDLGLPQPVLSRCLLFGLRPIRQATLLFVDHALLRQELVLQLRVVARQVADLGHVAWNGRQECPSGENRGAGDWYTIYHP